ncbi:hypothetical protein A0H81_06244 [Grifola frondosa]|uniref:Uncharacterized protein n=1 Tax=Grifola frondosa TaxID=5627 RepID=A0A1C7MB03_GRIFR|nr:hypothetical protein A0H81_06244 [Grifola frondosa]
MVSSTSTPNSPILRSLIPSPPSSFFVFSTPFSQRPQLFLPALFPFLILSSPSSFFVFRSLLARRPRRPRTRPAASSVSRPITSPRHSSCSPHIFPRLLRLFVAALLRSLIPSLLVVLRVLHPLFLNAHSCSCLRSSLSLYCPLPRRSSCFTPLFARRPRRPTSLPRLAQDRLPLPIPFPAILLPVHIPFFDAHAHA